MFTETFTVCFNIIKTLVNMKGIHLFYVAPLAQLVLSSAKLAQSALLLQHNYTTAKPYDAKHL